MRKITWSVYEKQSLKDYRETMSVVDALGPRIKTLVQSALEHYTSFILSALEEAESPIEQLMYAALIYEAGGYGWWDSGPLYIYPQFCIKTSAGPEYRVDFLIELKDQPDSPRAASAIVECDGHEFHEKTKEQARKDKRRDRELLRDGYQVFRYAGSEIWAAPWECASEIVDYLIRELHRGPASDRD